MSQREPDYVEAVRDALRSPLDVWGAGLLERPEGPTYDNVKDFLRPLLHTDVTDSGVYYVPLTYPLDGGTYALHVADGGAILAEVAPTKYWTDWLADVRPRRTKREPLAYRLFIGPGEGERIGSDLERLAEQSLAEGHLPILRTGYTGTDGVVYRSESFAARIPATSSLVSFLAIEVDAASAPDVARAEVSLDVAPMPEGLTADGSRLVRGDRTYVVHDGTGAWDGERLRFTVDLSERRVHHVRVILWVWPTASEPVLADAETFAAARAEVAAYWSAVLASGGTIEIPESLAMDAKASLLLQNLVMGHRYSIGNHYDMTFLMEGWESLEPLMWFGYWDRFRDQFDDWLALTNGTGTDWYEHWEWGAKLVAASQYFHFTGDEHLIRRHLDRLVGYMETMREQRAKDPRRILPPERWAWDIPEPAYGVHSQSWGWRGMRDFSHVLGLLGYDDLAEEYGQEAAAFEAELRAAIEAVQQWLPDGTLFIPVDLEPGVESAYDSVSFSRMGSYWNLALPWLLTAELLTQEQRDGVLAYMEKHGSWLLRMIRFNGIRPDPVTPIGEGDASGSGGYKSSGVDNAWGIHATRALSDTGRADELVLAFYARLAHGMTRGTFMAGEGDTVDPCDGEFYRSSAAPPNSTNNALYLMILRLMLLREGSDDRGVPDSLDIAWATPRAWLEGGKRIRVADVPTGFGDISYEIASDLATDGSGAVTVGLDLPRRRPLPALRVWLRTPARSRIVDVAGSPGDVTFDAEGSWIEVQNPKDDLKLTVTFAPPASG